MVEVYLTKCNAVAMLVEVSKYIFLRKITTFLWHDIPRGYNLFAGVSKYIFFVKLIRTLVCHDIPWLFCLHGVNICFSTYLRFIEFSNNFSRTVNLCCRGQRTHQNNTRKRTTMILRFANFSLK